MASKANPLPFHGLLASQDWATPKKILNVDELARPGYDSLPAHEYDEEEDVFKAKIKLLAQMIRQSKNCIVYTGAGISTASGISDYASRAAGDKSNSKPVKVVKKGSYIDYEPSLGHRALVALYKQGHIKWWCQQNHDGLPQKAGMPQYAINEIHGAWFDPTNPVVKMNGNLRDDLLEELLRWEQKSDLVIAVGTSLSGMNADRLVSTCARKKIRQMLEENGGAGARAAAAELSDDSDAEDDVDNGPVFGSVIIGLQRTRLDKFASMRIFAKIDKVFKALSLELGTVEVVTQDMIEESKMPLHSEMDSKSDSLLEFKPVAAAPAASASGSDAIKALAGSFQSASATACSTDSSAPRVAGVGIRHFSYQPLKAGQEFPFGRVRQAGVFEFTGSLYDSKTGFKKVQRRAKQPELMTPSKPLVLDLRVGQRFKVTYGPRAGCIGTVTEIRNGHFRVSIKLKGEDASWHTVIGGWMIDDALQGHAARLPVINC